MTAPSAKSNGGAEFGPWAVADDGAASAMAQNAKRNAPPPTLLRRRARRMVGLYVRVGARGRPRWPAPAIARIPLRPDSPQAQLYLRENTNMAAPAGKCSTSGHRAGYRPSTREPSPLGTAMYCLPFTE